MLYIYFQPTMLTSQYLEELQRAREELDPHARLPQEYTVQLGRHALAQAAHYSTRIEGNTLTLAQVRSLLAGEKVGAPADQIQGGQKLCRGAFLYPNLLTRQDC